MDRLRRDFSSSFRGLLTSTLLHVSLLVLLGLVAKRVIGSGEQDALLFSWVTDTQNQPVNKRHQMQLDAFQSPQVQPKPDPVETPEETPQATSNAPSTKSEPVDVKHLLGGRNQDRRDQLLLKEGGTEKTRQAIRSGLLWLKRQQKKGGNWQLHTGYPDAGQSVIRTDTGATALALLAFLGTGNSHRSGEHAQVVDQGLKWLMSHQKTDGDYHDHEELGRQTAFYAHAQATIAVCEAYALTGDQALRDSAQRAVKFLIRSQQPTIGGWKYQPQNEKTVGDLSVTGWGLMALHTARMGEITFPREAFDRASLFLDTVQVRGGALYRYEPADPQSRVSAAMTAEGLLCRQFLGWPKHHPALIEGIEFLQQPRNTPTWAAGRRNVYAWYYTGHVLHNMADSRWTEWYGQVQDLIVKHQVHSGGRGENDVRGSWHPRQPIGSPHEYAEKAGRLYLTSLCLLILEMPFRHLPIYGEPGAAAAAETAQLPALRRNAGR
ncbi:MAG: prenyltransferase/squalene oxidase repeat-containing protein [Planctomycetaceae bacterium]